MRDALELKAPSTALVASHLESLAEMRAVGEQVWPAWGPLAGEDHAAFVQRLLDGARGGAPVSVFWGVRGAQVVGRIALRHRLTPALAEYGGHISYEVRPSARRQGVGKAMLRALLQRPEAQAIGRLLLTCAPDNVGSNRTILANGGVLESTRHVAQVDRMTNTWWIDLR